MILWMARCLKKIGNSLNDPLAQNTTRENRNTSNLILNLLTLFKNITVDSKSMLVHVSCAKQVPVATARCHDARWCV